MTAQLTTTLLTLLDDAAQDDGHCFLTRGDLHARMAALVDAAILEAAATGRVVVRGGPVAELLDDRIYLAELDQAEAVDARATSRLL